MEGQNIYQLSSHILDISTGKAASNINIKLMIQENNGDWRLLKSEETDSNGRVSNFLPKEGSINNDGTYKLIFEVAPYFYRQNLETFFPYIEVSFNIKGDKHYHVPITLSPYGYGTYRGG